MKKTYKPSSSHFLAVFNFIKRNFDYKNGILCAIAFTILTVCTVYMSAGNQKIYIVKVNNKVIGYINSYDIYRNAEKNIKSANKDISLKSVDVERTRQSVDTFITSSTIEKVISQELGAKSQSVAIYANGIKMAVLSNMSDVKKVLEEVKKYYYPKISNAKVSVTSSKIVEKVETKNVIAEQDEILSVNNAIKKILSGRGEDKKYTIKDGDTIWDIALANDIDVENIQAANPKLNMDKIKIGQVIDLAVNLPYINVKITASVDSKEAIPYNTKNVKDKKLKQGLKRLAQHGRNGIAQIKKNIVIVNGNIIDENVISNKTLFAAKDEIIVIGGKLPIYAATGSFIKPARGMLSSRFGRRWGRMHEGIDIASPTGTRISAADSGKVTFVGRRGGYGLCIMISHGKGLQTLYGHTSKTYVKVGQSVKKGQRIAAVGSTGHSTGPHLHFEVRKNGSPVNPLKYLHI